jgi:hypothetical protein
MKNKPHNKAMTSSTNSMKNKLDTYRKAFTLIGLLLLFYRQGSAQVDN